jgi:PAS domain S-box-containing protein
LSFTTLMGLEPDDIAGHFDHDLFTEELCEFFSKDDELVLNRGESRGYEETLEIPGLGQRRMEMTKVPYQREDGDQIGLIGVVRDVTDRHRLEVLKEDVDHIMRHDLRSPLNGIKGIVGVIKAEENPDPEETGQWLDLLESEAERMNRLIDTSLCMIKMEQGSYEFDPQPVDIVPITANLEHELHSVLRSKQLELSFRVNGVKPDKDTRFEVLGNGVLVHSMLGNLVRNAAEASPKGETVYVDAWYEGTAKILIRNKGEVPESIRGRFFDKYATAGKKGGTGLGTYSARLIAENFGGRISMTTSAEAGTAVTLELQPASSPGKLINFGDYLSKTG